MRVFLILLCLVSSIANANNTVCQHRHCLAVVDAGSTGSRLHIYAYDLDENKRPTQIEQLFLNKITPGLASMDPKHLDDYLARLFSSAPEQHLPVYVYATAGMRLVSQPKQQVLYQSLQHWFANNPQWSLQEAKTISGKQEGIFGWLAVNYKLARLQSNEGPFVGVMDMGGASVQIAVPVDPTDAINPSDRVELDAYGRHITLFVHSFLGLGQTEVTHQYLNAANCFPYDYPLPNESMGQGDADACQKGISTLINSVHDVNHLIAPLLTMNEPREWYAVSGLGSLVKSKPFKFNDNQFTGEDLLRQADSAFCHSSWQTLHEQNPNNDYTFINCLTASYYYGLVVNGYGLQPNQPIHFMSDEDESDWTQGVILQQA